MTFTRPNTTLPFYRATEAAKNYQKATYEDTGKRVNFEYQLSQNGLVLSLISNWKDQAAYDEFYNDSQNQTLLFGPRQAYCQANGITVTPNVVVTV
jgi:hypothetical protein